MTVKINKIEDFAPIATVGAMLFITILQHADIITSIIMFANIVKITGFCTIATVGVLLLVLTSTTLTCA
jgi:hypothetical protein